MASVEPIGYLLKAGSPVIHCMNTTAHTHMYVCVLTPSDLRTKHGSLVWGLTSGDCGEACFLPLRLRLPGLLAGSCARMDLQRRPRPALHLLHFSISGLPSILTCFLQSPHFCLISANSKSHPIPILSSPRSLL